MGSYGSFPSGRRMPLHLAPHFRCSSATNNRSYPKADPTPKSPHIENRLILLAIISELAFPRPNNYFCAVFFTHKHTVLHHDIEYYKIETTIDKFIIFYCRHIFPSNRQNFPSKKIKNTYFLAPDFFCPPVQLSEAAQSPEESKRREFRK
jgi:hypothetical protein